MRHPTEGTLRRLVDEPAGVPDADREHVARCGACLAGLAEARADAAAARDALGPGPDVDLDAGWQRLSAAVAAADRPREAVAPPGTRWRTALGSPVVAGVGVLALLTGAGAAAAADWFEIFRTEQIAPLAISQEDLVALPELDAYGELEIVRPLDTQSVADAGDAEQMTGLELPAVADLPDGVTDEPFYETLTEVRGVFTFSAKEAARAAAQDGESLPEPPAGLDGSRFRLTAGPGAAVFWPTNAGLPGLLVARAVAPTAESSGISFETARDYLLTLPGMPEEVAAQLRTITADGSTLPLIVPAEEASTRTADVHGAPATVLATHDGTLAAVVWVEDGVVNAVAGSLDEDEVLEVARELEWDE